VLNHWRAQGGSSLSLLFLHGISSVLSVPVVVGVYTSKGPLGILRCGGRGWGTHFLERGLGGKMAPQAVWQRGQKRLALMVVVWAMREMHESDE